MTLSQITQCPSKQKKTMKSSPSVSSVFLATTKILNWEKRFRLKAIKWRRSFETNKIYPTSEFGIKKNSLRNLCMKKKGKRISLVIKSRICTHNMWRDNWICNVENDIGGADIGMSKGMYYKQKNERAYNPDYITFHIFANLGQFASFPIFPHETLIFLSLSLFLSFQL